MKRSAHGRSGRRAGWSRRLLLVCGLPPILLTGAGDPRGLVPQDSVVARILQRHVRLARGEGGDYRVLEALEVEVRSDTLDVITLSRPLPLLRLSAGVAGARWLGGDLSPRHLSFDPPRLGLVGTLPAETLRFAAGYSLPAGAGALRLESAVPVHELSLLVDRGSVRADPDPGLAARGEGGSPSQPGRRYVAENVAAGEAFSVALVEERVAWRQRLAVALAVAVVAVVAALRIWRRGAATIRARQP